jgi:hypothetical protein
LNQWIGTGSAGVAKPAEMPLIVAAMARLTSGVSSLARVHS